MNEKILPISVLRPLSAILCVVALLSLLAWPMAAFVSLFFFDKPGYVSNFAAWLMFGAIWTHPVAVLIGRKIVVNNKESQDANVYVIGICVMFFPSALFFLVFFALNVICGYFAC